MTGPERRNERETEDDDLNNFRRDIGGNYDAGFGKLLDDTGAADIDRALKEHRPLAIHPTSDRERNTLVATANLSSQAPSGLFLIAWMITSLVVEIAAVMFGILSLAITLPGVLAVAAFEGALLAIGQSALLGRWTGRRVAILWGLGTLLGALLGRAFEYYADVKFGPGTTGWNFVAQLAGGIALGFAVGVLMGLPQAYGLRQKSRRAWLWPLARGVAWAIALPLLLLAADLTSSVPTSNAFGGLLFLVVGIPALLVGSIEGATMIGLLSPAHQDVRSRSIGKTL